MSANSLLNKVSHSFANLSFVDSVAIPNNPTELCQVGKERAAENPAAVDAVVNAVEDVYKTKMYNLVSICVRHHGQVVIDRAYGLAQGNYGEVDTLPATVDSPVCLFSASKVISALLLLKLEELGLLSMQDTISKYLPEFAAHGKAGLTLEDLVSHRAKVPTLEFNSVEELVDHDLIVSKLCDSRPHKYKQAYHAITGGFIVGEVVEIVTGKPISKVLDQYFRKPLAMKYFTYGLAKRYRNKVAMNHNAGPALPYPLSKLPENILGFSIEEVIESSNTDLFYDAVLPSGNMFATAEECTRFYQMLLNNGEYNGQQVLAPKTVSKALQTFFMPGFDHNLKMPISFSKGGFMMNHRSVPLFGYPAKQAYGHLGFMNILNWADPERQIAGAMMTTGKPTIGPHLVSMIKVPQTALENFY